MDEKIVKGEKTKLPLTHSSLLKVLAFVLVLVLLATLAAGIVGVAAMVGYNVYENEKVDLYADLARGAAWEDAREICWYMGAGNYLGAGEYMAARNIAAADIICKGEQNWTWSHGDWSEGEHIEFDFEWPYFVMDDSVAYPDYGGDAGSMHIRLRIADVPVIYDEYWLSYNAAELCYTMRYAVYPVIAVAFVLAVLCLVYLLCAAGHRRGKAGVSPSLTTKIPFDLLTVVVVFIVGISLVICDALMWVGGNRAETVLRLCGLAFFVVADAVICMLWLMSLALRIKLRTIFTNTLIYMLLRFCWRKLKRCWGYIRRSGERIALFWKAALVFVMLCVLEFAVIMMTRWNVGLEVLFWFVARLALLAGLVYICHMLNEMYKCGKAVAEGNMDHEVDTRFMPSQFCEHAENLRSLSATVNKAVEQRMVSERMKTELITNVSHDLKTPLTSLINYSDLICRESCDNPHHGEYAEVLHRQSVRMKRLIDDLVEASKASSGNLDVNLAPCEATVLLAQAVGEYEQRLTEKGLQLVTNQPERSVCIMADGRRLWRVMDNLMNNICKYALPGTRVYLTLEEVGGEALISFKNTSRDQLNLSPGELMERFVRGDSSRSSEGSGLGLSIARSLTELQGGKMELMCDGDLFKVVLRFPVIR